MAEGRMVTSAGGRTASPSRQPRDRLTGLPKKVSIAAVFSGTRDDRLRREVRYGLREGSLFVEAETRPS
jgi:hypothetical protein